MSDIGLREGALKWANHFRIIPSKYPPINFFEHLVDSSLMDETLYIESLTNDRLRDEVGDIRLVAAEDRVSGTGSSYVMAAFTHPTISRFSRGNYGIYYASKELNTAIKETVYHTERFLRCTNESKGTFTKRVLKGKRILNNLVDIRSDAYKEIHSAADITIAQEFGADIKRQNKWGILYNSVRHQGGHNIAVFRPKSIELPVIQTKHLEYCWDGENITRYIEMGEAKEIA